MAVGVARVPLPATPLAVVAAVVLLAVTATALGHPPAPVMATLYTTAPRGAPRGRLRWASGGGPLAASTNAGASGSCAPRTLHGPLPLGLGLGLGLGLASVGPPGLALAAAPSAATATWAHSHGPLPHTGHPALRPVAGRGSTARNVLRGVRTQLPRRLHVCPVTPAAPPAAPTTPAPTAPSHPAWVGTRDALPAHLPAHLHSPLPSPNMHIVVHRRTATPAAAPTSATPATPATPAAPAAGRGRHRQRLLIAVMGPGVHV